MGKQSPIWDKAPDGGGPTNFAHHFQTPVGVARYMVGLIHPGARSILEPTPGIGRLLKALQQAGYQDVTAPADFFQLKPARFDCIVTNPPFSSRYAFMEHAPEHLRHKGMRLGYEILKELLQMSDHVIALMPWFTLSDSDVRTRTLKQWGLRSVTTLPRSTFQYARVQTVVLDLQRGYDGPTTLEVLQLLKAGAQQQLIKVDNQ